jgi:hypothetical protein
MTKPLAHPYLIMFAFFKTKEAAEGWQEKMKIQWYQIEDSDTTIEKLLHPPEPLHEQYGLEDDSYQLQNDGYVVYVSVDEKGGYSPASWNDLLEFVLVDGWQDC